MILQTTLGKKQEIVANQYGALFIVSKHIFLSGKVKKHIWISKGIPDEQNL